ncbi:phage terminase large subunit, partial [Bacillus sp. WP8]|uniref:phage terminase large subunit n=1 Tax=Bacillus sp. WP8 TaxID=756828 RepID=UPI001C9318C1
CSDVSYETFKDLLPTLSHPSLPLYIILSTNPVPHDNSTYTHFFPHQHLNPFLLHHQTLYKNPTLLINHTYYHHSTPEHNLFLPKTYLNQLDQLKHYHPHL